ncbi:lipoprotein LppA [Mycobacterium tuberculosis variant africanum]|nr:lipoprotein LppA [Mycobacterium tuberculosis variant africanum]
MPIMVSATMRCHRGSVRGIGCGAINVASRSLARWVVPGELSGRQVEHLLQQKTIAGDVKCGEFDLQESEFVAVALHVVVALGRFVK